MAFLRANDDVLRLSVGVPAFLRQSWFFVGSRAWGAPISRAPSAPVGAFVCLRVLHSHQDFQDFQMFWHLGLFAFVAVLALLDPSLDRSPWDDVFECFCFRPSGPARAEQLRPGLSVPQVKLGYFTCEGGSCKA